MVGGPTINGFVSGKMVAIATSASAILALLPLCANIIEATAEFNCKDNLIADEWREMVLNVHNSNRKRLAKGQQTGANAALPAAKQMNQLYWDCATEEVAREQAQSCGNPVPTPPTDYGTVQKKIRIQGTCNSTALVQTALRELWKEGAKQQTDQNFVPANKDFNQMAYEATNGLGCSYKRCGSELYLLCFYNKNPEAAPPAKLYEESATVCENGCADCTDGLCKGALTPLNEPKICTHQVKELMTDDLRDMALDLHNYYRRLLATGWAKDAKLGYAKPAAALPELKYDCTVEETILNTIKDCGSKTAAVTPTNAVILRNHNIAREDALKQTIENWWSALANTGIADNIYLDSMAGQPLEKYVNMAYQDTSAVACGVITCPKEGETIVQCGYVVGTQITEGDPIYDVGKVTCSGCKKAGKTCSPLGGLCV